jgi:hypothetical protein
LDSVSWLVQTHHLVIAWRTCISPETGMSNNSVERSSGQHGRRRQRGRREAFAAVRTVKAGRLFKKLLAALLIIAVAWLVSWLPGPPSTSLTRRQLLRPWIAVPAQASPAPYKRQTTMCRCLTRRSRRGHHSQHIGGVEATTASNEAYSESASPETKLPSAPATLMTYVTITPRSPCLVLGRGLLLSTEFRVALVAHGIAP